MTVPEATLNRFGGTPVFSEFVSCTASAEVRNTGSEKIEKNA